ncbi:hypothetical protein [Phyllobacterium zundukense]|uniref:Uncharacterized protein n=1 Tax=Phyllobacterium zundukense TaxID=1867719 RepID=A0A2N9VUV6_9HYPH|nr:hypothetical protein [Phyllobacterium zundukense]ATU95609.1 hypothetical protein BLM14_28195 [Phyllobacterium zundukense]PIO43274.1 hypothetical protein B5P45_18745 [Phyllobacterium zundukense]
MTGQAYIILTGDGNELWDRCLGESLVALGYDRAYYDAWKSGDYDAFLALDMAAPRGTPESEIKAGATLWFNRATRLSESAGDIWFHRQGNDLYWAESTSAPPVFHEYGDKVMIAKPVTGWSRRNRGGIALTWNSIHPRAKEQLVTQQAMFRVATEDMKTYLLALVGGESLSHWHDRKDWKEKLGDGKPLGRNLGQTEFAIARMMIPIRDTVRNSNGQQVFTTLRDKKLLCSEAEMKAHLEALMRDQNGLCADCRCIWMVRKTWNRICWHPPTVSTATGIIRSAMFNLSAAS